MTTLLLFGDTESSPAMRHEVPLAIGAAFMIASRIATVLPDVKLLDFMALGTLTRFSYSLAPGT